MLRAYSTAEDIQDIATAGKILAQGGTVIIPTETVYGLGANALDSSAVKQIFAAKGRPQDNPLIVHLSDISELESVAKNIPQSAYILAENFMPGPLTIILQKRDIIPLETSAGLETVAVRVPQNSIARAIIKAAGVPIAAPSANRSGSPSPTTFAHCVNDMQNRVDAIVESIPCEVGVESTVVSLIGDVPVVLRPGAITPEQLRAVLGEVLVDDTVLSPPKENVQVASPGVMHKHYAPNANVTLIIGDTLAFAEYVNARAGEQDCAVCFEEDMPHITGKSICYGAKNAYDEQAKRIFDTLRELDNQSIQNAYVHAPEKVGVGLAVYNRLLRSANFNEIQL